MLANVFGVRMVLWAGRLVPRPVSYETLMALQRVEVSTHADEGDGFQLTFRLSKTLAGEFDLLLGTQLGVSSRVIIGVVLGTVPKVLIDGIITHQELTPSDRPGESMLTVTGRDLSVLLDQTEEIASYPAHPDSVIALRILARYAMYGVIPTAVATVDCPNPLERIPRQHETDLACLQRLAKKNGFVFFIEPVTFAVNKAYFGPETRLSVPLASLCVGQGARSNVDGLSFKHDSDLPESVEGRSFVPGVPTALPVPALPTLHIPPLALFPTQPRRQVFDMESTTRSYAGALAAAQARQRRTSEKVVQGSGTLDTVRYGDVLRPRRLIGVRGAGYSFDGYYFVSRVTHELSREKYTQSFSIVREGVGSLLPAVL